MGERGYRGFPDFNAWADHKRRSDREEAGDAAEEYERRQEDARAAAAVGDNAADDSYQSMREAG